MCIHMYILCMYLLRYLAVVARFLTAVTGLTNTDRLQETRGTCQHHTRIRQPLVLYLQIFHSCQCGSLYSHKTSLFTLVSRQLVIFVKAKSILYYYNIFKLLISVLEVCYQTC